MTHLLSQMDSIIAYLDSDYHGLSRVAIRKVMHEARGTIDALRAALTSRDETIRALILQLQEEQKARAAVEAKNAQLLRDLVGDGEP